MLYKYELIRIKTGRFRGLSVTLCIMRHHAHIAAYTIYNICRPSQAAPGVCLPQLCAPCA